MKQLLLICGPIDIINGMSAALPRQCEQHQPLRDPSGRQRRLMRGFTVVNNDVENLAPDDIWQFTDYHGQQPYLDYDVEFDFEADPPTADAYDSMRYLPGQSPDREGGVVHAQQAASNGAARYYHADLTGSTNALTDTSGAMLTGGTTTNGGPFYYTSFGERVYYDSSSSTWKLGGEFPIGAPRYLYDGGHGYETGHLALSGANSSLAPITFQHVGQRWYQPEIGRFVQRDPFGLGGGLNVYAIYGNSPVDAIDPSGLKQYRVPIGPPDIETVETPIFGEAGQQIGVLITTTSTQAYNVFDDRCETSAGLRGLSALVGGWGLAFRFAAVIDPPLGIASLACAGIVLALNYAAGSIDNAPDILVGTEHISSTQQTFIPTNPFGR